MTTAQFLLPFVAASIIGFICLFIFYCKDIKEWLTPVGYVFSFVFVWVALSEIFIAFIPGDSSESIIPVVVFVVMIILLIVINNKPPYTQ